MSVVDMQPEEAYSEAVSPKHTSRALHIRDTRVTTECTRGERGSRGFS